MKKAAWEGGIFQKISLLILVLALLVGNRAGSFAGRLTRGLTLTAAALTSALLERSAGQRFNMFHNLTSLSDILCSL